MSKNMPLVIFMLLTAFLAALITASPVSAAPDELIQNGGFEAGTDPWKEYAGTLSATTSCKHSGNASVAFNSTSATTKWFYQIVTVHEGEVYNFSGWVLKNDANIEYIELRIRWYDNHECSNQRLSEICSPILTTNSDEFQYIEVLPGSQAPAHAVAARVEVLLHPVSSTPATAYFDDMSFEGPPPPTPSPSPTATATVSPMPTATATPSPTDSVTVSPTSSPTATGIPTATPTPSSTPTPTPSATPTTTASQGEILINEVQYNPPQPGSDASFEWLELYNPTDGTVELRGWSISDNYGTDAIPPLNISADSPAIVAASQGFHTNFPDSDCTIVIIADGSIGNGLSNDGDSLSLKDGAGTTIDSISYGDDETVSSPPYPKVAEGHSLERSPAGGIFIDNPDPSPCSAIATVNATPYASCTATPTGGSTAIPPTPSTSDADEDETQLLPDEPDEPVDPVLPALAVSEALALCGVIYMIDRKRKQKSK